MSHSGGHLKDEVQITQFMPALHTKRGAGLKNSGGYRWCHSRIGLKVIDSISVKAIFLTSWSLDSSSHPLMS